MQFYASWYTGDPNYAAYDPDASMLISVTSVSRVWRLTKLDPVPKHLIIDSGGFRYAMTESKPPSPRQVFQQQLDLIDNVDQKITLCALDHPMLPGRLSPLNRTAQSIVLSPMPTNSSV